jgi:hypothetical protein
MDLPALSQLQHAEYPWKFARVDVERELHARDEAVAHAHALALAHAREVALEEARTASALALSPRAGLPRPISYRSSRAPVGSGAAAAAHLLPEIRSRPMGPMGHAMGAMAMRGGGFYEYDLA